MSTLLDKISQDDSELLTACINLITEESAKIQERIFIAEDIADAFRDGFSEGCPHSVLSDGRVVWISNFS